jgi:hypothetical protein
MDTQWLAYLSQGLQPRSRLQKLFEAFLWQSRKRQPYSAELLESVADYIEKAAVIEGDMVVINKHVIDNIRKGGDFRGK